LGKAVKEEQNLKKECSRTTKKTLCGRKTGGSPQETGIPKSGEEIKYAAALEKRRCRGV